MQDHRLDQIQNRIYEELIELVRLNRDENSIDSGADTSSIIKRINRLLLEYKDSLNILERRVDKDSDKEVSQYHHYVSKLSALRSRVRVVQLEASDLNRTLVHTQRIKRYNLGELEQETTSTDQRELLFANRSNQDSQNTSELSINQQILSQNKQITSSLQATRQLLTSSILQSELNIDSLDQQTKDLHHLSEEFMKFSDLLNRSRQIVKFIEKQDKGDKQRIYLAFTFFALCCIRIIWKRILRTPVRIFLWTFFKAFGVINWMFGSSSGAKFDSTSDLSETIITSLLATAVEIVATATTLASTATEIASTVTEAAMTINMNEELVVDLESTVFTTISEILMDEL